MGKLVNISEAEFEETLNTDDLVLVDFWAEWCGPCRMLGPTLEQISNDTEGVTIAKVNVDENRNIAINFGIRSIPTVVLFKRGEVVDKFVGAQPKEAIMAYIAKHSVEEAKAEETEADESKED